MLDLMILYLLIKRDLTMYAIHKHIKENFGSYTNPSFGAVKPALVRLEKNGCITSAKLMSEGGKLSIFYSITGNGMKELKNLLQKPLSKNPIQFMSDARIKLSCLSVLDKPEIQTVCENIKEIALFHKLNAEKNLSDEYISLTPYQKIVLDNAICEYKNFVSMVEGLEKS